MAILIFHKNHLETDSNYVCSKTQVRRILSRKAKVYQQDTKLAGDDDHSDLGKYPVSRNDGTIKVGCKYFSADDVALVRKWLRGVKVKDKLE